jgi:single-stranded DNA-binding protein
MSLTVLITGKLVTEPSVRQSVRSGGRSYTMAKLAAATEEGDALCTVIGFGSVGEQLAAMAKGDTVSISGRAKLSAWMPKEGTEPRAGLFVTADHLLTVYHLRRRRLAASGRDDAQEPHE